MEYLFVFGLYVAIPVFLGRVVNGATWLDIGKAYLILWGLLLLFGLTSGASWGERFGWPMILGMFFSIPGIPLILWLMRQAGWRRA